MCVMCINIYLYFVFITESKWERETEKRERDFDKSMKVSFHSIPSTSDSAASLSLAFFFVLSMDVQSISTFFSDAGRRKANEQARRGYEEDVKIFEISYRQIPNTRRNVVRGICTKGKKLLSMDIFFMLCWEFCIVCFHHVSLEIIVALFTHYVSPPLGLLKDNTEKMR